jgi:2-polyprenyl-3-methyl-5-hydroxy-6-metoxy-1,4-benzoquinol methylase
MNTTVLKYDFDRRELLPFIPDTARSLLDVGCGSGAFGRFLSSKRPGMELWAIEPDPTSAQAAQDAFDRVVLGKFPDSRVPNHKFDVVVCADVLEHMTEPEVALRAAAQATAAEGVMVASIPNVRNWQAVLWPLLRHGKWEYTERGILDRTHMRFFTRGSMRDLFTDNDWLVESITGINLHRRERVLSAVSGGTLDDFLFPQYVVVARPVTLAAINSTHKGPDPQIAG